MCSHSHTKQSNMRCECGDSIFCPDCIFENVIKKIDISDLFVVENFKKNIHFAPKLLFQNSIDDVYITKIANTFIGKKCSSCGANLMPCCKIFSCEMNHIFCKSCIGGCEICEKQICASLCKKECFVCKKMLCSACSFEIDEDVFVCKICQIKTGYQKCSVCDEIYCSTKCQKCNKNTCDNCFAKCDRKPKCAYKYCNNCVQPCRICLMHFCIGVNCDHGNICHECTTSSEYELCNACGIMFGLS